MPKLGRKADLHELDKANTLQMALLPLQGLSGLNTDTPHELLSATHTDTTTQTVSRGSLIYGNSASAWDELTVGGADTFLQSDGTDVSWGSISAGQLPVHTHIVGEGGATIAATSFTGAATVSAAWTHSANIALDDGAGDSPTLAFVGGSNNDTISVFLADSASAGYSDLRVVLSDTGGQSRLEVYDSTPALQWAVNSDGNVVMSEDRWIGIGFSSERLIFDGTAGQLQIAGADLYFNIGLGIIHADGVTAGQVLRANGTRYVPDTLDIADITDLAYATPSLTLSTSNAAGSASSVIRSDATILVFDVTNPTSVDVGDAASAGLAGVAARRDHQHAVTSSSSPGAAASLLASSASGYLQLVRLGIGVAPGVPLDVAGTGTVATLGDGSGTALVQIDGAAANSRNLLYATNGSYRWGLRTEDTAEGGSEAGSNFEILRYSDAGSAIAAALTITRANGNAAFENNITLGGTVDGVDLASFNAAQFVTLAATAYAANERVLTAGDGLDLTDAGAGNAVTLAVDVTDILGSGLAESSNNIDLNWGTPTIGTIEPDDSANAGTSTNPARSDHQHAITCAAPSTNLSVSSTNAEGSGSNFARSTHTHSIMSNSSPGAAAAILASDASGYLQLVRLGLGVSPDLPLHAKRTGVATDAVWNAAYIVSKKSSNMADGFGTGIRFRIEDDAATENTIAQIAAIRDGGVDTEGALTFSCGTNGIEEFVRINNVGAVGIGVTSMAAGTAIRAERDSAGAGWWCDQGDYKTVSAEVLTTGVVSTGVQFGAAVYNVDDGGAVQYTNTDMDVSGTLQTTTIWTDGSSTLYLRLSTGGQLYVVQNAGDAAEKTFRVALRYAYV